MPKEPKILIVNPVITCGQCQKSQITLPHQVDVGGMSQGAVFDGMLPMVQPMGWTLIGKPGERKFACPACLETARELERQQMPAYDQHSACAKCGNEAVEIKYNGGIPYTPFTGIEYVQKTCLRCRASWKEKTLDQTPNRSLKEKAVHWLRSFRSANSP